jgi:carboxypeptidase family protein
LRSRPLRTLVLCALLAVAGGWCALRIFSSDARGGRAAASAGSAEIAERPPAVLETPAAVEREALEPEEAPVPVPQLPEEAGGHSGGLDGPVHELDWFARIVDGQSGAPLAGVRVVRIDGDAFDPFDEPGAFADAPSDASGSVRLRFPSQGTFFARAELAGHSTAYAQLEPGHGSPSASFTLLLFRAAALELHATDLGGVPRADLRFRVTHKTINLLQRGFAVRFDESVLETRTDALGTAVLEDLPANVAITARLFDVDELLREERELRLEPGERRTLEWSFGTGCTLEGLALESDGSPAADVHIWLLPDDGDLNVGDRRSGDVIASTRSAADGSFAFEGVGAGSWYVCAQPALSEIAALAVPVLVLPEQERAAVTLTCWRGLYVSGRVLGPGDEVTERSHVFGILVGSTGGRFVVDAETEGGEFSLGPLPPGSYNVRATCFGGPFSDAAIVTAVAGTEDVLLRLGHGASLEVEVLDGRGNPAPGTMVWVLADDGGVAGTIGMVTDAEGKAGLDGRRPGVYTLSASSPAGEFVRVRDVQLVPGATTPIELRMVPSARLRLRVPPERARGLSVRVLQDGHPIAFGLLGGDPLVTVPPGELELELARWGDEAVIERHRVLAVLGEEIEVVFEGEAPR